MTKSEEAAADREWQRALQEHAAGIMRDAIHGAPLASIMVAPDNGGLAVAIQGPDGEWRRYYVRLTEVRV